MAGWMWASAFGPQAREAQTERELRERERLEAERAIARARRQLEELEGREREHADVFQILPELVRQMFAATSRRAVAPIAMKLVQQVFEPEQAAAFLARPLQGRLVLAEAVGLPASIPLGTDVEVGSGRVGYVAETRMAMDDGDFRVATSLVKRKLEAAALKGLVADVVAPVEGEEGLIAVLSVGGIKRRQAQAKRLLKMVADLTGVAFTHVTRLRNVEHAADVDGLTGALNKRAFQKRLGDEIHRAEREQLPVSLLILDIDHFKNYNDTNGHLEGDQILKQIGKILRSSVREDDVVARYGGEEFIVLYPGASKSQGTRLAEAIRQAVERTAFAHGARQPLGRLTISGGVATFPEDSRSGVELIRCADQALYEAKAAGRNKIVAASQNYLT